MSFNTSPGQYYSQVGIPGLQYHERFLSEEDAIDVLQRINSHGQQEDISRRTQQYGFKYPYQRSVSVERCEPIPSFLQPLVCTVSNMTGCNFDQIIINEYEPGQGIRPHIDAPNLFGNTIISISLGSRVIMYFDKGSEREELLLDPGSMLILTGESRYLWKHSIPNRKSDLGLKRGRRVSITIRRVNPDTIVQLHIMTGNRIVAGAGPLSDFMDLILYSFDTFDTFDN